MRITTNAFLPIALISLIGLPGCEQRSATPTDVPESVAESPSSTIIGGGPLSVDTDGLLPIDFEPISHLEPISSFGFDLDGDGSPETIQFSAATALGSPTAHLLPALPGTFLTPTTTVSSQPNTSGSQPVSIILSRPVVGVSLDLVDTQFPTVEVMAQLVGLDVSSSTVGEILEALDLQNNPRGTTIRAYDPSANPVAFHFEMRDYDPALPTGPSQVTDLSATGGPVTVLSVPGSGSSAPFSAQVPLQALGVTIVANTSTISRVVVAAPTPGTTGVPNSGDFIVFDNLGFIVPVDCMEQGRDLIDDLEQAGLLNQGQTNSLKVKLNAAARSADKDNIGAAVNQIEALIDEVAGLINGGVLTPGQGQPLIESAHCAIGQLQS